MDAAKAAATIALTDDSIRKYHGTGSEVTCVSVLTDRKRRN